MAHLYERNIKGKTYWYLREVHRVEGKVRVKWQKYLGTAETILARLERACFWGRSAKGQEFGQQIQNSEVLLKILVESGSDQVR